MKKDIFTELVELCQELVRRQSLSGQEGNVAAFIEKTMRDMGYSKIARDRYGNISGSIVLGEGKRKILLEGHMDHVDVADPGAWSHPPYAAEIVDGKIYGRGTSDMKGNLAAMMMAGSMLRYAENLDGEIIVAGAVHEECFEGVASEEICNRWNPDCVVIGEASSLNIKRGQRGRAEIVLETFGKPAHSSNPEVGLNAVKTMMPLLAELENYKPHTHPVLGQGILELTDIISTPYPGASVLPERCRVTFDRRLLVGETKESVISELQNIVDSLAAKNPKIKAKLGLAFGSENCYTGAKIEAERFAPAWLFDDDNWFVADCLNGLRMLELSPEISHFAFCTNGSYYAGKAGIPTIGFGGSLESLAHVTDEYIEIDQLEKACKGYLGIILQTLQRGSSV